MGDLSSAVTVVKAVPGAGGSVLTTLTGTLTSASETITLNEASHGVTGIDGILGAVLTGGMDAALTGIQVARSGATLTVTSFEQDGTASTDWTGATFEIGIIASVD